MTFYTILVAISTYLICSINPAIEICKRKTGQDIRKLGSGNAGTANAMRVLGKPIGTLVVILDIGKVFLALFLMNLLAKLFSVDISSYTRSVFMIAAIIGHCYPIYYGLRGGKGVIVGMTIAFTLDMKSAIICMIAGSIIILITRMVAMGTLCGTIMYIVMAIFTMQQYIFPIVVTCVIIMFKHRANIKRIITRQEEKI